MRDLTSRLRDIVEADGRRERERMPGGAPAHPQPFRELTYVPESRSLTDPDSSDVDAIAASLGGSVHRSSGGACVTIDRTWDPYRSHGWRAMEAYTVDAAWPLALFDPRLAGLEDWASRVVFFDIETTGLSGGAGTLAFLVGCGWFDTSGFTVRQFLLIGPGGERAMLDALDGVLEEASLLVTYNGRSFDVPLMEMRWAFHRRGNPTDDLPHFDMLPPARKLWSRRDHERGSLADDQRSCSLSALERAVLGFHRLDDVPGFEIPTRYFQFLRTGEASAIEGVLEHNRHDLVSLAAVTAHAFALARGGPGACRDAGEQLGLGRLYEQAGDEPRARAAYTCAASHGPAETRRDALARLAVLLRRSEQFDEAAAAWAAILESPASEGPGRRRALSAVERRAAEALAIHHEHRGKDPVTAKRYAEWLRRDGSSHRTLQSPRRPAGDGAGVEHRLGRLARKIDAQKQKGGPEAAPLLKD